MTTLHLQNSVGRSPLRLAFLLIPLTFVCFALSPAAHALLPAPTPDGAYPNWNTAEGSGALFNLNVTSGSGFNTAIGGHALYANTTGSANTAVGAFALAANNAGSQNVAVGQGALRYNSSEGNVAAGYKALFSNTDGFNNTANGLEALYNNTIGFQNTANGTFALFSNTTGLANTASGENALLNNTTGSGNTALGFDAGDGITTANNVVCIGPGVAGADVSNTTWIGNIYGVTTQSGTTAPVIVSDTGQLGTVASSERFKKDIATMDRASEAILSLRPVTFHYKSDTKGRPQFGLIAEEVAKVNPALVLPDQEGKPYTVRYDAVNAMLLNEFLKEHRKVEQQEATITQLKSTVAQQKKDFQATVAQLTARLDQQASQIQKVSAQLEASKSAPQVVNNN
jgi:hypothetical protein